MAIVTLTTDWGDSDYYPGAMKGILLSNAPDTVIVDISHFIEPYDHLHGRWVLGNCWFLYPDKTVHVIGFRGTDGNDGYTVVAEYMNHFFIGSNDGFLSLLFGKDPDKIYYVLSSDGEKVRPDYEVLATSAAFLSKGGKIKDMGHPVENVVSKKLFTPVVEDSHMSGYVTFIDRFGNLITNITKSLFEDVSKSRSFEIYLRAREYIIDKISSSYEDVSPSDLVAFFNAAGHLEIAMRNGDASQLLGINLNDVIRVEFNDN